MRTHHGWRPLLALDPELGRLLDGARLETASRALLVRTTTVPVGAWDLSGAGGVGAMNAGLLVLEGVIARELTLDEAVSSELIGPGDLLRPWALDDDARQIGSMTDWNVLAPVRVALMDRSLMIAIGAYPEITAVLMDRLNARSQRLVVLQAIAHLNRVDLRLEAMLWHLADRWGRVTGDGVAIPLALSHRALAELVGACRPTVSTALGLLSGAGRVTRRRDGTWLLDPASRRVLGSAHNGGTRQRRHLFSGEDLGVDPTVRAGAPGSFDSEAAVSELWAAIDLLYERAQTHGDDVDGLRREIATLHQHAHLGVRPTRSRSAVRR